MKHIIQTICKMRKRLMRVPCGLDSRVDVFICDAIDAFTQDEDGKTVQYPETIEVKIENWSNHFYSVRVSDGRWIPEGSNLDGRGLTSAQVYRRMLNEVRGRK